MSTALRRRLQHTGDLAKAFPRVHFVGIGGTGMSGIAEVMCTLGYQVSGSDMADNAVTRRLAAMGATVHRGHAAANVLGADCVVVSSAIKRDNPELMEARAQRIPVVPRAEMLAELMRFRRGIAVAGTHGKTTTTSLTASVLAEGGIDPTFVIGGKLLAAGANAGLGGGQWLVAEADESDGSFLRLNPQIAIVTNIDADHLENYGGDFAKVQAAFEEFLHRLPFYGLAVLCIDDANVARLAAETPRHVMTYGFSEEADVRAEEVSQQGGAMRFTLCLPDASRTAVTLALPGRHNVLNALAAASVAWQLGVTSDAIARALEKFAGIGRRFNLLAQLKTEKGATVQLVDDYGHHPKELEAVFAAARGGWPDKRLVVAFQPHRYSRTRDLFDDFAAVLSSVDALVLTEVYPAGEAPIAGADAKSLARAIRARGRIDPVVVGGAADLAGVLPDVLNDGDLLLLMGAGDIGAAAQQLASNGFQGESK
ncbi:UDP-N-acetylmuramate--L-alanine ligase [Lysobacter sp. BMK333-48F3]|uniref:UDP-N-acetylmuramate--L-alanine ligase n=1 Tax=Lysobacter sp. BMK333-48F3 TaxID=2867962 RepID=UPI001C8BBE1B|nr:UDP-N-acetylmuramate--L-alanine ligase [Lysobacter sp. BMK333-48F3]MBX9400047.1 UDP-N-acetylmuramate--L-alanine ligase [Lysobacter sp. BMK333-48F3]